MRRAYIVELEWALSVIRAATNGPLAHDRDKLIGEMLEYARWVSFARRQHKPPPQRPTIVNGRV